ncbi:MAG: hypothetical protein R2697_17105 [Ilumatobacteraceae bacterium]
MSDTTIPPDLASMPWRSRSRTSVRSRSSPSSEPSGDQPKAIAALAEGITSGERFQTLLGITGSGKSATIAWTIEAGPEADAHPGPEQESRRPARPGDARLLPEQPGRVLRVVLRLLPTRGVHPVERHLHREGLLDQRRDRPAPPLGDSLRC